MYLIQEIDIDLLEDNPYDQRKRVGDIESLAESIRERGLQNPITVVKVEDHFVIAHGHRRTHAFRYLKRKKIPAIVRKESTPEDLMIDLAIENLQRKDLLPPEKGATIEQLFYTIPNIQNNIDRVISLISQVKLYGTKDNIGEGFIEEDIFRAKKFLGIIGMSTTTAAMYIRLLSLPDEIKRNVVSVDNTSLIPDECIVTKSAYELTRIKDPKLQKELFQKTVQDKMSHIELKHIVDEAIQNKDTIARCNKGSAKKKSDYDADAAKLVKDLFELSSRVDNFRSKKLPFMYRQCSAKAEYCSYGDLQKIEWKASLDKMKKACLDTVKNINDLIKEDMKMEELLEYANADLEINITNEMRYRFPNRVADILKVKEGDILLLKVEGIRRLPPKLEDIKTDIKPDIKKTDIKTETDIKIIGNEIKTIEK